MIPPELKESIARWVEHGIEPGSFLLACLSNDLKEACARADMENRFRLFDIVSHLYNDCPALCWGSPERVAKWAHRFSKDPT